MRNLLLVLCALAACGGNTASPALDSGAQPDAAFSDGQRADGNFPDVQESDSALPDASAPDAGVVEPDGAMPQPDGSVPENCGTPGDILVVDRSNNPAQVGLKRFSPDGTSLGLFAAQSASGPLHIPLQAIQLKDCRVLVADIDPVSAPQIRAFGSDGTDLGQFWSGTPGCNPWPLELFALDESSLLVGFQSVPTSCGTDASSLWRFSTAGEILDSSWNTGGQVVLDYSLKTGIDQLPDESILAISNGCNFPPGGGNCQGWSQVERFDSSGVWLNTFGTLPASGTALLMRSSGDVLVAYYPGTAGPYGIRRFSATGEYLGLWSDMADVTDMVEREDGVVLAATDFWGTVEMISADGASIGALVYPPAVDRPHSLLFLR